MTELIDENALNHAFGQLSDLLGERASRAMAQRQHHSHGEGIPDTGLPDIVVFPQTTEEVAQIAEICHAHRLPMVPFGAGSSLEGHVTALKGGVSINLMRMDKVLSVSQASMDCRVEAGVTREDLNAYLRDTGLFFPLDPGANASLGGMAGTRASGTNAVGYGTMRDVVMGLTVVTPDGRIVKTGSRARKSSTGYDLTRLYVGSEGTLGIITEVQLKLFGQPESIVTGVYQFANLEGAIDAATMALQCGLQLARIELLDDVQMRACINYSKLTEIADLPTLFVEFHGTTQSTAEQSAMFAEFAQDCGCTGVIQPKTPEVRNQLWKARHDAYHASIAAYPGKNNMGTDACVPIENLAACLLETKADVDASGLAAPIVGHVGDGNFHLGIMFDESEREVADAVAHRVSQRAIRFEGTCSGEHGIGLHKIRHMTTEHGEGVELMRSIKQALDPLGLMNPGKVLPEPG